MKVCSALCLFLALILAPAPQSLTGKGYSRHTTYHSSRSHHSRKSYHSRIHRSEAAKREFLKETGYPHGRKGYVVDHVVPLACGGADAPSNMQWQTKAEAKAKDRWERKGCQQK